MAASVIIYTLNEEVHIARCLSALRDCGCDDIVVVDSFSTDRTEEICRQNGVRFYRHRFTGFGDQRNWSLENVPLAHPWAFVLDADEVITPELWSEISEVTSSCQASFAAFRVSRRLFMWKKWLRRSSLYPTWVVRLVRIGKVRYVNRGHGETQIIDGRIGTLKNDLRDENLKGTDEWFDRQNRYSRKEAEHELSLGRSLRALDFLDPDPLVRREAVKALARRLPLRGLWYFIYAYFLRRGFLDGRAGFHFCLMKAMYQQMIALKKEEALQTLRAQKESGLTGSEQEMARTE